MYGLLRAANVEGEVLAQFVVDTNGRAEMNTFKVLKSSHELFTISVQSSLPQMRFNPAEIAGRKVRQVVQMPFVFALNKHSSTPRDRSGADEAPKMLNKELPFHYPFSLFAEKVDGNVTLRLFIDRDGRVRPESTRVVESSGYAAFDSAAIRGSPQLQFVPAKKNGEARAVTIILPVYFRFPGAPPLPQDTSPTTKAPRPSRVPSAR